MANRSVSITAPGHTALASGVSFAMDPLGLLPYALAAGGGRMGNTEVSSLVAAGLTLLQRSAPLVRALAGRRAGVLMPMGPAWVVALAAGDGRGLVLLDTTPDAPVEAGDLRDANVGAVFTTTAQAYRLPRDLPQVLLDAVPARATIVLAERSIEVDLGSHFGLALEGDSAGPGAPEECFYRLRDGESVSHRAVLAAARALMARAPYTPVDRTAALIPLRTLDELAAGIIAPLLVGGTVRPPASSAAVTGEHGMAAVLAATETTIVVGDAGHGAALLASSAEELRAQHRLKHLVLTGTDDMTWGHLTSQAEACGVTLTRL